MGRSCVQVRIPRHAYAMYDLSGPGRACNRGCPSPGGGCIAIDLAPHAFLSASGDHWSSERGYSGWGCVQLQLPPNAHLDLFGNSRACNAGHAPSQIECVAVG